jgi:hypothetical protein
MALELSLTMNSRVYLVITRCGSHGVINAPDGPEENHPF